MKHNKALYFREEVAAILCDLCRHGVPLTAKSPNNSQMHEANGKFLTCDAVNWLEKTENAEP